MEGGAKNINFKCAYMLSLDFDNGISIKDLYKNGETNLRGICLK